MHREHGIEKVGQSDAMGPGYQSEKTPVAIKAPWAALFNDLETRLVVAVKKFVGHFAGGRLIGQFERLRAEPLHVDDRDEAIRQNAPDGGFGL